MVRVPVRQQPGKYHEVSAVLDTGYSGSLTLPPAIVRRLGLRRVTEGNAVLADGSVHQFDIYAASVSWDGEERQILVYEVDSMPLLGMALLVGFDLRARITPAGRVEIERLPPTGEVSPDNGHSGRRMTRQSYCDPCTWQLPFNLQSDNSTFLNNPRPIRRLSIIIVTQPPPD